VRVRDRSLLRGEQDGGELAEIRLDRDRPPGGTDAFYHGGVGAGNEPAHHRRPTPHRDPRNGDFVLDADFDVREQAASLVQRRDVTDRRDGVVFVHLRVPPGALSRRQIPFRNGDVVHLVESVQPAVRPLSYRLQVPLVHTVGHN
jgi:hypothetical protein